VSTSLKGNIFRGATLFQPSEMFNCNVKHCFISLQQMHFGSKNHDQSVNGQTGLILRIK